MKWWVVIASAALVVLAGCSTGDDAVAQGGTFEFVAPGGKTDIFYDPPESRGRPGPLAGPDLMDPATTLSLDDVRSTVDALEKRFGTLTRPGADDICYATQNRQDAVKRLAEEATLILVIGSETSSNAQRLVEVARLAGAEAVLIDGESELGDEVVSRHEVIGLTAGASTPGELVDATIEQLGTRGYDEVIEITVAREDVHFRLPREVASA